MTAAPTLLEKMAQAMFSRTHDQPWDEAIGDPGSAAGIYLDDARAALAVVLAEMRKPSRDMLEAAANAPDDDDWLSAMGKAYGAMIAQFEREQADG